MKAIIIIILLSSCTQYHVTEDFGTNDRGKYHVRILTDTTYLDKGDERILNLDSLDYE